MACSCSTDEMLHDKGKFETLGALFDHMLACSSREAKGNLSKSEGGDYVAKRCVDHEARKSSFFHRKVLLITYWLHSLNSTLRQRGAVASVRLKLPYQYCLGFHSPRAVSPPL